MMKNKKLLKETIIKTTVTILLIMVVIIYFMSFAHSGWQRVVTFFILLFFEIYLVISFFIKINWVNFFKKIIPAIFLIQYFFINTATNFYSNIAIYSEYKIRKNFFISDIKKIDYSILNKNETSINWKFWSGDDDGPWFIYFKNETYKDGQFTYNNLDGKITHLDNNFYAFSPIYE